MHYGHYWVPMFWGLFALAIILTRRYTRHRERMRALEVAERLAVQGVAAPEVVSKTLEREPRPPRSPMNDLRAGAILIAVSIGMLILGFILTADGHGGDSGFHPLYGVAAFPGLIGLVFLGFGLASRNKV
jgi:hypothetical protein